MTLGIGSLLLAAGIIVLVWDIRDLWEVMGLVVLFLFFVAFASLRSAVLAWLGRTAGLSEEEFVERMTSGDSDRSFRGDVRQLLTRNK